MLKILQARLQQYVNRELPDVQVGFIKGRGSRDQIAKVCWIMEKARELQSYLIEPNWRKVQNKNLGICVERKQQVEDGSWGEDFNT